MGVYFLDYGFTIDSSINNISESAFIGISSIVVPPNRFRSGAFLEVL